jgi:hypothetical protein
MGGAFADSWSGNAPDCVAGMCLLYVHAGDVINPGY